MLLAVIILIALLFTAHFFTLSEDKAAAEQKEELDRKMQESVIAMAKMRYNLDD